MLKAAAVQMCSGRSVALNLAAARELIEAAARAGATLVALPENFALMAEDTAAMWATAEVPGQGPIQTFLATLAKETSVTLVGGSIPLREPPDQRPRASTLVFGPSGELRCRYDKIHLFDASLDSGGYQESARFAPGASVVTCAAAGTCLGIAICYDLRFPDQFLALAARGAEVLVVPSAFTEETGRAHWDLLVRTRAIDTLSFVVAPAQGGRHDNGRRTHGESMIVDPWGRVLGRADQGPGLVLAELDLAEIVAARRRLPAIGGQDASA